jgi:hypothetical protein
VYSITLLPLRTSLPLARPTTPPCLPDPRWSAGYRTQHFGGIPSDIWAFSPDAQYDSFLFAAPTTDMPGYRAIPAGYLSSVGIDFDDWTADSGLSITDGAVFVMDPDNAAAGPVVAAQVTVPAGVSFTASMGAQGHNMLDRDWQVANGISNPEIRQSWNQEQIVWNVTPSGKQAGTVGH